MHEAFSIPNIVDTSVLHKQAWMRLTDKRSGGEDTLVHSHKAPYGTGEIPQDGWDRRICDRACVIYHRCPTDNEPRSHSIAEMCPTHVETGKK